MRKSALTMLLTLVLISALHQVPGLAWITGPSLGTLARAAALEGTLAAWKPVEPPPPALPPPPPNLEESAKRQVTAHPRIQLIVPAGVIIPQVTTGPLTSIVDDAERMQWFYEALARTESFGAKTRILHYGDSPITADSITADARAILQAQFGDGGHGFILMAKPWEWYMHRGVSIDASGWIIEAASQSPRTSDNLNGLGGASFTGWTGASSTIHLPDRTHSRIEVAYLRQPQGGQFKIDADGVRVATVSTDGPAKQSDYAEASLPPGTQTVQVSVVRGAVRIFGINVENSGRGVVYSSLGLNGASAQHLVRYFDKDHWTAQLLHAGPDLVILNYGTNESVYPDYVNTLYPAELRELLTRVRDALPKASILVMSPADRGERKGGVIVTLPVMPKIVGIQRQIAEETGCAFFDTFHAMGGPGTMARWYDGEPRLVNADYTHPLPQGSALIASLLDRALMEGYAQWKERHP